MGPLPNQVATMEIEHTVRDMFRPETVKSLREPDLPATKIPTASITAT
jgi:hypothetical protein